MTEPRTLCELFQFSLEERPREVAYLRKIDGAYRPVSSQEMADRVLAVASGLRQLGVQPGDRVAIVSENRLEWALADFAILHCAAVTVPIYPTLPAAAVRGMLRDSETIVAFVSDTQQLAKLTNTAALPHLRHAILLDGTVTNDSESALQVHSLRELDSLGVTAHDTEGFERVWRSVTGEDLATIIYTSGTSGVSKGVMLTHANILSNVRAMLSRVPIRASDRCLSFLPLSHILERTCGHFGMWSVGATIAYAESVESVPQNLLEVQPTILISVPRLYEKMNARVLAAVQQAPVLRQKLFAWAQSVGRERVRREQAGQSIPWTLALRCAVADRLVFTKLRMRLGGNMRVMVSGGAPLSESIAQFFFAAGLPILEGYGLTETSPVISVNPPTRPRIGTVGPPLEGVEVRIAKNGEILARGPNIMKGYYGNPEATAEVLVDGWFHTGDVGELDPNGYLRITDRIKDLIVTAGGKNIAPQPIEARLKASQYLVEAILIGDRRKYLSALVIPNFANLEAFALSTGLAFQNHTDLVRAPEILRLFENFIGELNTELAPFERIKRFYLLDRELNADADEITPSMKVKRSVIGKTFAQLIDSMYVDPPGPGVGSPASTGDLR